MSLGVRAIPDWRGAVDSERYGTMTADDHSFTRLTGLVKLRHAARRLGIRAGDLRGRVASGTLRGRKVGSTWYVSESELERYADRRAARRPGRREPAIGERAIAERSIR